MGCSSTGTAQVKINSCTGLDEIAVGKTPVLVYPNPSSGDINISAANDVDLMIVNELGQLVYSLNLNQNNYHSATVKNLSAGVYFVVGQNTSNVVRERIVVLK